MSQPKWEEPEVRASLIGLAHDGVIQTRKARQELIEYLKDLRWIHFGDLDQKGFNIGASLARTINRPLIYWEPAFLKGYIELFSQAVKNDKTPWEAVSAEDSTFVRELKKSGRWMEQEPLIMDRRLEVALQKMVRNNEG